MSEGGVVGQYDDICRGGERDEESMENLSTTASVRRLFTNDIPGLQRHCPCVVSLDLCAITRIGILVAFVHGWSGDRALIESPPTSGYFCIVGRRHKDARGHILKESSRRSGMRRCLGNCRRRDATRLSCILRKRSHTTRVRCLGRAVARWCGWRVRVKEQGSTESVTEVRRQAVGVEQNERD